MLTLQQVRRIYPEYNDWSDYELGKAIQERYYPQEDYAKLAPQMGAPVQEDHVLLEARRYAQKNPGADVNAVTQQIREKDRSGVGGFLQNLGEGIYDAVTDELPQSAARIWRGGDIVPGDDSLATQVIDEQQRDMDARIPSLQEVEDPNGWNAAAYRAPSSVVTSLMTGGVGSALGGAVGGMVGGPPGATVGSMAGNALLTYPAFYRLAKDQFVEEVQNYTKKGLGRDLTLDEAKALNQTIESDAQDFGTAEAGPEAVSNLFTFGLFGGATGKLLNKMGIQSKVAEAIGKRAITRIPAKMGAEVVEEEATEAWTYLGGGPITGQEELRYKYGMRETPPTLGQFLEEEGKTVALGAVLMGGGAGLVNKLRGRGRPQSDTPSPSPTDEGGGGATDLLALPPGPNAQVLRTPEYVDEEGTFDAEFTALPPAQRALPRGTGAMPMGTEQTGRGPIASPYNAPSGDPIPVDPPLALPETTTPANEGRWPGGRSQLSYAPSVDSGETVDLLAPSVGGGVRSALTPQTMQSKLQSLAPSSPGVPQQGPAPRPALPPPTRGQMQADLQSMPVGSALPAPGPIIAGVAQSLNAPNQIQPRGDTTQQAAAAGMPLPQEVTPGPNVAPPPAMPPAPASMPMPAPAPSMPAPVPAPAPMPAPAPVSPPMPSAGPVRGVSGALSPMQAAPPPSPALPPESALPPEPIQKGQTPQTPEEEEGEAQAAPKQEDDQSVNITKSGAILELAEIEQDGDDTYVIIPFLLPKDQHQARGGPVQLSATREGLLVLGHGEASGGVIQIKLNPGSPVVHFGIPTEYAVVENGKLHLVSADEARQILKPAGVQTVQQEQQGETQAAQKQDGEAENILVAEANTVFTALGMKRMGDYRWMMPDKSMHVSYWDNKFSLRFYKNENMTGRRLDVSLQEAVDIIQEKGKPEGLSGSQTATPSSEQTEEVKPPSAPVGSGEANDPRRTRIAVPGREKLNVSYDVVEADEVQASHLPSRGFEKNAKYAFENERRYHAEPASRAKVLEAAAQLDPDRLMEAPDANQGAPIVDQDGNVLGGNGRAMSIQRAYETPNSLSAQTYRNAVIANAGRLGLDPTSAQGMNKPILIRRVDENLSMPERQGLISALNEEFTHSRDIRSESKSRGDRFSQRTLKALAVAMRDADSLRQMFDSPGSASIVEMLVKDGVIQESEKNALVGTDGLLNPDGKTVVERSLRGRIARKYETLAALSNSVVGKLDAAVPHILCAEQVGKQWNITEDVRDAVDLLAEFSRSGEKETKIFLSRPDMFSGKAPRERFNGLAVRIFESVLTDKKADFTDKFARYSRQADISPENNGLGGGLTAPQAQQQIFGATAKKPEPEAEKGSKAKPDSVPVPAPAPPSTPPAPTLVSKQFGPYNDRRYSRPWGAKITLAGEKTNYSFDGKFYGDADSGGTVEIPGIKPGDVVAFGQKDTRGSGSGTYNEWFIVQADGSLEKTLKDAGVKHLRERRKAEAQQPKPSETSAPAVLEAKPAEPAPASPKDEATTKAASLSEHIAALFADGRSFTTIVDARKEAAAFLGEQVEAGTARAKEVEEAIELAVVLRAREIVADMREKDNATPDADIFRALVKLYDQQPILGSRSSTSIAQQAYSTPVPLAFLASRLAGISGRTTVYEPTAGNGALLIEASPKNTETNELNPERAKNLEKQGFTVTQSDAAAFTPERTVDVVIANPPFGTVKNADGQSREFEVPVGGVVFATYDLDHAIVARALLSMKGDGRAVLIIGGKQGHDEMKRQKYRAASQIKFYKMLYENYSVLDHFTIDGKLYAKQGAAYPIDVIVIGGKGKTEGRPFPGGKLPRVYESFDALEEVIVNGQKRSDLVGLSGNPAGSGNEVVDSGVEGVEGGVRGELGGLRGGSSSGAGGGISGDVGGHNGGGLQRPSDGKTSEDSGRDSERGGLGSSDGRGPGKPLHGGNDVVQPVRHPGERVGDNESGGVEQDSGAILAVRDFSGESQRDKKPDVGRPSEQSGRPAESSAATQHVKRESTTYQNPYQPASKGASLEVYIPKNMGTAARDALGKIEAITGSIDQYVADALDYSEQELHKYFSAEQIDALALAIHNMTAGKGFIIGDMTGIGKGRVNAAILRWAKLQGHIPVFVTQKDQLYSDMGRDLADIGMKNFRAIATNESLSSREGNQSYIEFQGKGIKGGKTLLPDVTQNGTKNYDAVFTTYAQISGNNDRPTPRRRFLESIAARAVFILDEAHTGGGEQQKAKKGSSENIAAFLYSLLKSSPQGVFYSSATYAKRPDNMILYFKTDIRDAVNDIKSLPETIKQGGVPLQQVVASMLTEAGQYLRREHSYQGVNVNTKTIAVPKENAVASAQIMTQIMNFSDYVEAVVKSIDNSLADLGGAAGENQSTGDKGASSTSFSSIMHNLISQFLLAQKAEATALSATEKVNQGKKVVIALQNTLEAPMKTFIEAHNLKVGDAFRLTFSDLFKNYLEQTRMITEKTGAVDHKNKPIKIKRRLTDEELGPAGVALYNSVLGIIEKSRLDLPVSPIDHILHRLREMGVKAGEITGRGYIVDYSGGGSTLARRTTGAGINKQATDDFNNGMIDALIINTSGSTGISLHSSKTFKDQKQRVMIISQAALDINTFVQTLGRVFRTGQVNLPEYELLFSDLPIEKRPAAVLAKKMASLNANTTASGKSDTSFKDTVDFMNEYGDEIVNMVLGENPELISRMGLGDSRQITIAQLTGRIPLLPLDLQEEVYAAIEMEYENHIQQLKDAGQYSLEAQSLPLDAKLISETEFIKAVDANGASPFSQGANLGVYDVKRIGKPFTSEKVKEKIRQGKEELVPFEKVLENNNKYYRKQTEDMDEEKAGSLYSKLQGALSKLRHIYRFYSVGNEVSVSFGEKDIVRGIVTSISRRSGGGKNPVALSAWSVRIALADARREIDVPVSQIMRDNEENKNAIEVTPLNREAKDGLFNMFDNGQSESREDVVIATGNILAAFDALIQKNRGARIISFTDNEGNTRLGVLMRGASVEELMSSSNVALSISQSLQYLNTVKPNAGIVRLGSDRDFVIVRNNTGNFNISVPAARARGQQYYGNRAILAAAGQDFFKVGQSMVLRNLDERTLRRIMDVLEQQGRGFVTDVNTDVARDIVKGEDPLASLSPAGEHMPPPGPTIGSRSVRHTRITSAVEKVQKLATRAAETKIVRSFAELPTHIKQRFKGRESALEGVYDPGTDTVYLVTENLASGERAVEVWLHENLVHHGLRSLFRKGELSRLLNRLWDSQGGMGNAMIREIAERYELDPRSNMEARHKVMEEYLANLAEKASIGELTGQEATWWRRFIAALREAWQRIVSAATGRNGRMGTKEIDRLLRTLGRHVFEGTAGGGEGRTAADPAFSLRTRPDPKKTKIAYKLFRVRKDAPGKLFPLYVGRNEAVELGVWHDAEIGEQAADGKVKSKLGPLAMRPGWHAGDVPMATHIGGKEPGDTAPSYRQEDQVWAEVEVAHDVDWQAEADRRAQRSKSGQKIPRTAHITDSIPEDGLYRYKTNPNMTGNWIISGAMRVNRILSDAEVADINAEHGLADLPRKAPFDAEAYGFEAPLASLKTILGIKPSNAASAAASPQIRVFLDKEDLGLWERLSSLPHWIAKNFPAFAKVYDRQLKRMDERSAMLEKSLKEVSLLFGKSAKTLSKEDMADANRIIWEHEGKDIPELKDIEKFLPDGKLESGRTKLKVNPAYRTAYRAWLSKQKGSDKAKELVEQIRSSLDNDLLLAYNRMAEMRELNDTDIDKYRMAIGHQQNYFPHHRYGDYYVQAKVNGEVVYRKHFDLPVTMPVKSLKRNQLKAYADEVAREQAGNFPDAEWSVGENTRLPEEALGAPIDTEAMEQIILAAAAGIKDPAHRKDVIDTLKAGSADVLKARGFGSHYIGRKGIPGHETEDILKILYDYKAGLTGWLTKMEASRDLTRALGDINAKSQPNLWAYAQQYVKDMLRNSDRLDRMTGNIKAVAFAWYLGGSIKTAMVNATQNIVVGVPRLSMDANGSALSWIKSAGDALIRQATGKTGSLTADEARLIDELYGEAVISDAYMEEVRGQLRGIGGNIWNKFTKVLGMPMSAVERFNRASLALAAYQLARKGNLKPAARKRLGMGTTMKADYETAKKFASEVVRDAHFVYGKSNTPEFLRSNAAGRGIASAYTFRTFTHNMLRMWAWALASQGTEGRKFVAKSIGATIAIGGLTAIPFYATMQALVQAATDDDDDWTETIRKALPKQDWLRDIAVYGMPTLGGMYVGGSLKMETPATHGIRKGGTLKETIADIIGDMIGIPYDLLVNKTTRIMDAKKNQNWYRMVEEASPVALKNGLQAWRLYTEGQTSMKGRPINDPGGQGARKISGTEAGLKALGFPPVSATKSWDAYMADKRREQVRSDKIDQFTVQTLKAQEQGDTAAKVAVRKDIEAWNTEKRAEGKPSMVIKLEDVQRRVTARKRENSGNKKVTPKAAAQAQTRAAAW